VVGNSYGFLLNGLDSLAGFNVRKIAADASGICGSLQKKFKSFTTEDTEFHIGKIRRKGTKELLGSDL
jgi:hypothetical protein